MHYSVTAFYKFAALADSSQSQVSAALHSAAKEFGIVGLVVLGSEGVNGTVAGSADGIKSWKATLEKFSELKSIEYKDSYATSKPFRRFKIDSRPEIVTLNREDLVPKGTNNHLSPKEWQVVLDSGEPVTLIDVRNKYEVAIGKFKNAVDPETAAFGEFSEFVRKFKPAPDRKVLMYCTGGIRCEKAIYEMQQHGVSNVYQLEGGILKYLEQFPNRDFEGECFVFDHRVSVDQNLQPSKTYKLCPHCGNPGKTQIRCQRCAADAVVCDQCLTDPAQHTCSKNCAHHARRGSKVKGRVANALR
jgi:UPF0176 protein